MNSKRVGNIGEARVLYELVNLGFPVYQQFGDNELADYIIINNDDLLKLQVKTSSSGNSERELCLILSLDLHLKEIRELTILLMM